ncbi:MAG: RsmD family RNA methyltransferase [bacterium]|nr:RsmD family RNA methyltransferase [bacterium]
MADFIRLKEKESFIEIGSGIGCLSFIIFSRYPNFKRAMLVEIQREVFDILEKNIEENNLRDKVILVNNDARRLHSIFPHLANSFDVIFTNPPHIKSGEGKTSPSESKIISTTEAFLTLDDVGMIASYFLKIKGRLYIIHRSERLKEIISSLDNFGLEVKRMSFVYTNQTRPSKRVLIEARKGGRPGVIIEPPIFL